MADGNHSADASNMVKHLRRKFNKHVKMLNARHPNPMHFFLIEEMLDSGRIHQSEMQHIEKYWEALVYGCEYLFYEFVTNIRAYRARRPSSIESEVQFLLIKGPGILGEQVQARYKKLVVKEFGRRYRGHDKELTASDAKALVDDEFRRWNKGETSSLPADEETWLKHLGAPRRMVILA